MKTLTSKSFCLPIHSVSRDRLYSLLTEHDKNFYYFELWIEYLKFLTKEEIFDLSKKYGERIIWNIRRFDFSPVQGNGENIILEVLNQGMECKVDLDFKRQTEILAKIDVTKISKSAILSFHDYSKTPKKEELQTIVADIKKQNPWVVKVSCMTTGPMDSVRLLEAGCQLNEAGNRCVILGMGEYGVVTRTFGTHWYNEFVYCRLEGEEGSAPGQVTREQVIG